MRLIATGFFLLNALMIFPNCLPAMEPQIKGKLDVQNYEAASNTVRLTYSLRNDTKNPITISYCLCESTHVTLFTENGEIVYHKPGTPIPECPFKDVEVVPGEVWKWAFNFPINAFYTLEADNYEIGLFAYKHDSARMTVQGKTMPLPAARSKWKPSAKSDQ